MVRVLREWTHAGRFSPYTPTRELAPPKDFLAGKRDSIALV